MTSLFGNDPVSVALDSVNRVGLDRWQELMNGFETDNIFDASFFQRLEANRTAFSLTSVGTKTEYGFVINASSVTAESVQVTHVATCGNMLEEKNWSMMTLTRGDRGQILARPGW